jgi:hypothetical protein
MSDSHANENVHLVRATRPNSTNELRVSFSFHEKKIMRQLSTVEGQLFVLLKFIFKRLLPRIWKTPGLKTYHAKTLLFFMLEKHGRHRRWQPSELISLLKESLDMMIDFMNSDDNPDVCMPHFFMSHAPLYVKNAGIGGPFSKTKWQVRDKLSHLRSHVGQLEQLITNHVCPLRSQEFFCHPFTLLPLTQPKAVTHIRKKYYFKKLSDSYSMIFQCIHSLQSHTSDRNSLMQQLSLLPNECRSARLCMTAMTHVKFGEREGAEKLLREEAEHRVVRGVETFHSPRNFYENWLFRFCFPSSDSNFQFDFHFLPEFTRSLFTVKQTSQSPSHLYVNFSCLWWSLQAELVPDVAKKFIHDWMKELRDAAEDADLQELLTVTEYSRRWGEHECFESACHLMEQTIQNLERHGREMDERDWEKVRRVWEIRRDWEMERPRETERLREMERQRETERQREMEGQRDIERLTGLD